jgi:hypothetical protein
MMSEQWPGKIRGPMDVLSEYKKQGEMRAVGATAWGLPGSMPIVMGMTNEAQINGNLGFVAELEMV